MPTRIRYFGTSKTWRYADHLGSVIAEADAVGNATAIRGYGPFGENGTMAPNRFDSLIELEDR